MYSLLARVDASVVAVELELVTLSDWDADVLAAKFALAKNLAE